MSEEAGDRPLAFEVLQSERLLNGFRAVDRLTVRHASLTGKVPSTVRQEVVRARPACAVLAFDPERDTIVAIRQFRIGAALATPHAGALELPAGLIDDGESPEQAARRELAEETGLDARALAPAFAILPSPGVSDEQVFVFLALVDASRLPASAGLAGEGEDIVPLAFAANALIESADAGRIVNGFLFAGLQWFARQGRIAAAALAAQADTKGAS